MSTVPTDDAGLRLTWVGPPCPAGCGGHTGVEPWPAHAAGCACAARAKVASQREAIEKIAQAGSLKPHLIARIADGTFKP